MAIRIYLTDWAGGKPALSDPGERYDGRRREPEATGSASVTAKFTTFRKIIFRLMIED
jgi:hypothetical protein